MKTQTLTKLSIAFCFVLFVNAFSYAQQGWRAFTAATFGNKNVYKTKISLQVTKAYENNRAVVLTGNKSDTFTIVPSIGSYIRYKVVADEGDFKYIRILPGCNLNAKNEIVFDQDNNDTTNPEAILFRVSKKILEPNNHYLASSALIGKVITLPVRIRSDYWDNKNTTVQGALSVGMSFGWKFKFGNNPYHSHYFNVIAYGAAVSQQKYFNISRSILTGKDSASAKTDEIAVTWITQGISYEYDKFNIGLFWGMDKMFGNLNNWAYQNRFWWGIGVGYELFK